MGNFRKRNRILSSGKSPSLMAMKRTYNRAILNGGVTQDFSANIENIREISRKLGYNILSDATFVYVPSSYGEGKNFAQVQNKRNLLLWSETYTNAVWDKTSGTITANTTVAPNGTLSASTYSQNGIAIPTINARSNRQTVSTVSGQYTFSVYIKKKDLDGIYIQVAYASGANGANAIFNTVTGVLISSSNIQNYTSTDVGNGWFRFSITLNQSNIIRTDIILADGSGNTIFNNTNTFGTYIWGAQLETGAYATPYQKTVAAGDGIVDFNFTRATSSTVTNKQGVIEDSCYNLLQQSEDINNAIWTKTNSVTYPNVTTAPNGSLTADKLSGNTLNTVKLIKQVVSNTATTGFFTASAYLKKGEQDNPMVILSDDVTGGTPLSINLTTGTIIQLATSGSWNSATSSISDAGNGWYRVTITANKIGSVASTAIDIRLNNNVAYIGDNNIGVYIWGAQLVQGSTPRPYLRTTNRLSVPKLDYSRSLLEPSLLIERQATNLLLQSETFDNVSWNKLNSSISPNLINAPNNTLTADKLIADTSNTLHQVYQIITGLASTTLTFSIYLKAAELTNAILQLSNNAGSTTTITIDLTNGTVSAPNEIGGLWSNSTTAIKPIINGWYYITLTSLRGATVGNTSPSIFPSNSSYTAFIGNNINGIYIWGAQLEVGSNATTYIPTTTTTVTRNGETCYTDLFNNAALNSNNFTLFAEGYLHNAATTNLSVGLSDTTATGSRANDIGFFDGIKATRASSSAITSDVLSSEVNTPYSFAVQRNGTTVNFFKNGVLQFTQTVPVVDYRYLVVNNGGSTFTIDKISLFNRTLTNTECSNLTMLGGLNKNLVAYYKLNSSTTDSLGLSPTGTATGVDYVAGKTGSAARFNASTDRIDIADTTNLSFTDGANDIPFSINMWVYFTSFNAGIGNAGNWLINKRGSTNGQDEWQLLRFTVDGKLYFQKFDKVSSSIFQSIGTSTSPFSLNTWYMITVTDNGSKTYAGIKLYINNVLQTTTNSSSGGYTGMPNGSSVTRLGLNSWSLIESEKAHDGYIEDVGIWKNRVLTQSEVTQLYNAGNGLTYPLP